MIDPTTEPGLPYHRLAHLSPRTAQWWRPLAIAGVGIGLYLGLLLAFLAVAVPWALIPGSPRPTEEMSDPLNPLDWILSLGLIALMLPAAVLGVRWGGGRKGTIHSVTGRFRWGLMFRGALFVVPVYALVLGAQSVLFPPADFAWPPLDNRFFMSLAVILALGPLQCAAEE